jgi:predicted metal-dependent peptidase
MPEDGMYCSSIDLDVDYVEDIYEKLVQQGKENGYFNDTEGKHEFTYKGSKENNSGGNSGYGYNYSYGRDDYDKHKEFHITVDTKYVSDLIDDGKDQLQKENDNKKIMAEAKMKHEMMDKSAGNSSSRLQFEVEALLNSKVDWKRLLRKYCIVHRMSDTSFNTPDKRMHYQSAIYPGLISENELVLDNVKLCVDTSGSMSDDDIGNVIGQVVDLTKQFKTTAELISWDASIESTQMIDSKTIRPAKKSHLAGRGGTDPRCLFEYFDSKQCKIKPFVTIIFTDGFIYSDEFKPKWTRKYKNTIWIMTRDYNSSFVPPFGNVAYADFSRASKR